MTKQTDFAEGLYSDDASAAEIPRSDSGTLRVMAVREPCRTSAELEARCAYILANPIDIEFDDEAPLTSAERANFASEFTPEEWAEIERLTKG